MLSPRQEVHNLKHYLKMKINDIMECANKALEAIRQIRGIDCNHFFTARRELARKMGPIKEFTLRIEYIKPNEKTIAVITKKHTQKALEGQEENDVWEMVEKDCLSGFFALITMGKGPLSWDKFVTGEYNGIE